MRKNARFSLTGKLLVAVGITILIPRSARAVDWNWPNNQIPSDQKAIDKAYTAYQEGDVDTALIVLNGVKGAQNNDCRARHILADIYLEQKRYGDAKRELQDMYQTELALEKANTAKIGWVNPPQIRLEYAKACAAEGNHGEAINIFRELQNSNPKWVEPRYQIAYSYELQGDHEQARNHYKGLLESDVPMDYGTRQHIEQRLAQSQKRLETPAQGSTVAPSLPTVAHTGTGTSLAPIGSGSSFGDSPTFAGPGSSPASFARPVAPAMQKSHGTTLKAGPLEDATVDIRNRKFDAAIVRLKDYLTRQPKDGQAHYLLAIAYASTRQYTLARDAYEKTLQHGDIALQKLATVGLSKLPKSN
ncbi:MAG: tetratricopeptide repeat protein [Candidatus Obscuribacterales bacterium]|jgi:Flp pilus assembly protein TadD|nr:tetratricopeptide repeat protein [Candidatus Obscuribacterales bacterium]